MTAYTAHPLVHGFPGKSASHGAFGWSSLWLVQGEGRCVLVDTGQPAYLPLIHEGLAGMGLTATDVTDVLITHLHWDHVANFTVFAHATIWVGEHELTWAAGLPAGTPFIPDLHVRELQRRGDSVQRITAGSEILPGVHAISSPGHTPNHIAFLLEHEGESMLFAGDAVKNVHELSTGRVESTLDADTSRSTIDRLRSLMSDTGATLIPGHDVGLELDGDSVRRRGAPRATISFFADGLTGEVDWSIG